jgi:hypothetical protein
MADSQQQQEDQERGLLLLLGGGVAFLGSLAVDDPRVAKVLMVGGLGAAGVGLYYLVFKGLFGRDASTGHTGGLVGGAEDVLVGGLPGEVETPTPTVYLPPPPDEPLLSNTIPFTGRVLSPPRDSSIETYFGRDFYRVEIELTNNTLGPSSGLLELHADEMGTYGGSDAIEQVLAVQLGAGETKRVGLDMRSTAGYGSFSSTILTVRYAGHHIETTGYTVE